MYASVIIEYGVKAVDREYTYIVPERLRNKIRIGHRVKVPFNNRDIEGFVLSISSNYDSAYELKEIIDLCDDEPILNEEMLYLGEKIQKNILCSKINIFQAMLPKALKADYKTKINVKRERYIVLNVPYQVVNEFINKCISLITKKKEDMESFKKEKKMKE